MADIQASGGERPLPRPPAHPACGVGLYLIIAFGFTWTAEIGLRALGVPLIARLLIAMFGPAIAAFLVRGPLLREGFADAGLSPRLNRGGWRWYLAAYLAVPLLLLAGVLLALATTVQRWGLGASVADLTAMIAETARTRPARLPAGMSIAQVARISIIAQIVQAFTLAIPINMVAAFGEEFGWRGYLLPRLLPRGPVAATLIVGVIWGIWHAPVIVLDGYNFPGHPWLGVGGMVVFTVSWSFVFTWLWLHSGTLWTSVLLHGAINAQGGVAALFLTRADSLIGAPIGVIGVLPVIAFVLWLIATGRLALPPADVSPAPNHRGEAD